MANRFVYKDVEGATTQWDDLQRKFGNLPPKPEIFKPAPFTPADDPDLRPKSAAWIDEKSPEELEELEDDDMDDDRFLQEYRKKRLAEIQEAAKVVRYGSVVPISGSDFVHEVSQAPQDVWVVVFLYKDGVQECGVLLTCLEELATRYPATKFVKIISTDCIPNYPDRNLPTILVYNNGAVKGTLVGLSQFGARRCTPESVALALCKSDPVLNDGHSNNASKDAVIDGVRKRFIEKLVTQHEDEEDYSTEGFRGRSYNIKIDDNVLLRFSPKNSDSTYYFGDMIGGTLKFFHEDQTRRCLGVSVTLETSESINQQYIHPSRRGSPTITKVHSEHHMVVADIRQTSFLFSVPIDGPMTFSTPKVYVQWSLKFEFFTTPEGLDISRYEHPLLVETREKGEWVLLITVYAPPSRRQAGQSRSDKSSSLGNLFI